MRVPFINRQSEMVPDELRQQLAAAGLLTEFVHEPRGVQRDAIRLVQGASDEADLRRRVDRVVRQVSRERQFEYSRTRCGFGMNQVVL